MAKSVPAAALIVALAALPRGDGRAVAAEVDCQVLYDRINQTRALPVIRIDPAEQTVHVRLGRQNCTEPVAAWTAREPSATTPPAPAPEDDVARQPAPTEPPVPAKPPAPVETHPMFKAKADPPPAPEAAAKPDPESPPPDTAAQPDSGPQPAGDGCSRRLDEFWSWSEHTIAGVPYDLARVFTIDLDRDGITDNVGFKLTAPTLPDLVIRYNAAPGRVGASAIPSLRLADESVIPRLCFGQLALEKPKPKPKKQPRQLFEPVDLAKEMAARQEKSERPADGAEETTVLGLPFGWAMAAGLGILAILAAAAGGYFLWPRLRRGRFGKKAGDDDDEEDEDEDRDDEAGKR